MDIALNCASGYNVEQCHANVDATCDNKSTPLFNAPEWGHLDIVKYFVEQCHANVDARNSFGHTSLYQASHNGRFEIVRYLVENCHAKITDCDISKAKTEEIKEYLRSHMQL